MAAVAFSAEGPPPLLNQRRATSLQCTRVSDNLQAECRATRRQPALGEGPVEA